MKRPRSTVVATALAMSLTIAASHALTAAADPPSDDATIVHVLNRLGFGPRPGDVERVRQMGVRSYIEQQLHPERLPDTAMTGRLAGLTTLSLSSRDIADRFERPALEARRERTPTES